MFRLHAKLQIIEVKKKCRFYIDRYWHIILFHLNQSERRFIPMEIKCSNVYSEKVICRGHFALSQETCILLFSVVFFSLFFAIPCIFLYLYVCIILFYIFCLIYSFPFEIFPRELHSNIHES